MSEKKVAIFVGGWEGHTPVETSEIAKKILTDAGWNVDIHNSWEAAKDLNYLKSLDLIVPLWTMAKEFPGEEKDLPDDSRLNIMKAVSIGVGMAGCHGGMNDSFRTDTWWQFMTGSQFVTHPGGDGTPYKVQIKSVSNPLVAGIKDFEVESEQYYMHIDPVVEVLASTQFPNVPGVHTVSGPCEMPVVYTKGFGNGRVWYTSLGHTYKIFENHPEAMEIFKRGLIWAASNPTRNEDLSVWQEDWT